MKPKLAILILAYPLALLLATACSSYQAGTNGKLDFKHIYIAPAKNDSYAPQAQALLTKQLMQALLQESSVKVTNQADADATLEVTLSDFGREESSTQAFDTQRARSYDTYLEAACTLINTSNGKVYFKDRKVRASVNSHTDDGLQAAEYRNMPALTEKLAHKIRDSVISTW